MTNYTKPEDLDLVWASSGITSRPSDFKWLTGWEQEKPPFEQMNYVHNKHDSWAAYSNQKGIPEWDNSTIYYSNSYAQANGRLYKSKTNQNTNNNPTNDLAEANWRLIFDGNNRLTSEADFTPFGKSLIGTTSAGTARTLLGATPTGNTLFTATNSATARSVLGFTTTGENILTATNISNAQSALGFSNYGKGLVAETSDISALQYLGLSSIGRSVVRAASSDGVLSILGFSATGTGLVKQTSVAAMRTYLGTTNASYLSTGTVSSARLPLATTVVNGVTQIATQVEVDSRSTMSAVVTPATMGFGVAIQSDAGGHITFPRWLGGIRIKWGQQYVGTNSNFTLTGLFSSQCWQAVCSGDADGSSYEYGLALRCRPTGTGILFTNRNNHPVTFRWFAVGV